MYCLLYKCVYVYIYIYYIIFDFFLKTALSVFANELFIFTDRQIDR